MNPNDMNALKKLVIHVAAYYGRDLLPEVVAMMANDLARSGLSFTEISDGYEKFRSTDKTLRFPVPAQIIAIARPQADNDSLAQEAAARVIQAIGNFGWTNPEEARAFVGELGWRAVTRFGGWQYICENVGAEINQQTIFAQVRDLSRATLKLDEVGIRDQPIAIGPPSVKNLLERADFTKFIEGKKL